MPVDLPFTDEEIVLRDRYEVLSIVNDLLIALWFLLGSVLFFREATTYAGTWLFVVGSAQLAVRPVIRLTRRVHLQRVSPHSGRRARAGHESADDF